MPRNSDPGPAWVTTELPYPVAHAWHLAHLEAKPDANAIVSAIETALRFVAALQVADMRSRRQPLPTILTDGGFSRPTLGSWVAAVRALRAANRKPFTAALSRWPERDAEADLRAFVEVRNTLSHAGEMDPRERRTWTEQLANLAVAIITSLDWLRSVHVISFLDAERGTPHTFNGGLQVYRGSGHLHPRRLAYAWKGSPKLGDLYLAASSARDEPLSGAVRLLPLAPFMQIASLKAGVPQNFCLFSAVGSRGDVQIRDGAAKASGWAPMPEGDAPLSLELRPSSGPHDARTTTAAKLPPVKRSSGGTLNRARATKRTRPVVLGGLAGLAGAAVVVFFVLQGSRSTDTSLAAPTTEPRPPLLSPEEAFPAGAAHRPVEPAPAAAPAPSNRRQPARAARRPPPTTCTPPALAGPWRFETTVLGAHADRGSSIGVRGFYTIDFAAPGNCTFATIFTKTGFTVGSGARNTAFRDTPQFIVSPSSQSVSGLAILRTTPTATDSTDIGFRLMPVGDHLIGLWRYEGAGRVKAGFWGALHGHREGVQPAPNPACFLDCIRYCHGDRDADDPDTERCLSDCAPRLTRCDK